MSKIKKLYRQIWQKRPHRCKVCGYPINVPLERVPSHVFSHVFSKGAHPSLKYEPKNIELWCSTVIRTDGERGCHTLWHTNPEKFWERANKHGWEKPSIKELKNAVST